MRALLGILVVSVIGLLALTRWLAEERGGATIPAAVEAATTSGFEPGLVGGASELASIPSPQGEDRPEPFGVEGRSELDAEVSVVAPPPVTSDPAASDGSSLAEDLEAEPKEEFILASITGYLRHESGAFQRPYDEVLSAVHVDISGKLNGERVEGTEPSFEPRIDDEGALVAVSFRFDELDTRGRFEVTLSTVDHQRWSAPSVEAFAPSDSVEFMCYGEDATTTLSFEVLDDETGDPIEGAWKASEVQITSSSENGVLVHAAPLSLDGFPVDAGVEWVIEADGYAPHYGNQLAFDRDPKTGALSATVRMKRGFSARLIVLGLDPDRTLAKGASVSVDGQPIGRTDARGTIALAFDEAPSTVQIDWQGQRLGGSIDDVLLTRRSGLLIALLAEE